MDERANPFVGDQRTFAKKEKDIKERNAQVVAQLQHATRRATRSVDLATRNRQQTTGGGAHISTCCRRSRGGTSLNGSGWSMPTTRCGAPRPNPTPATWHTAVAQQAVTYELPATGSVPLRMQWMGGGARCGLSAVVSVLQYIIEPCGGLRSAGMSGAAGTAAQLIAPITTLEQRIQAASIGLPIDISAVCMLYAVCCQGCSFVRWRNARHLSVRLSMLRRLAADLAAAPLHVRLRLCLLCVCASLQGRAADAVVGRGALPKNKHTRGPCARLQQALLHGSDAQLGPLPLLPGYCSTH